MRCGWSMRFLRAVQMTQLLGATMGAKRGLTPAERNRPAQTAIQKEGATGIHVVSAADGSNAAELFKSVDLSDEFEEEVSLAHSDGAAPPVVTAMCALGSIVAIGVLFLSGWWAGKHGAAEAIAIKEKRVAWIDNARFIMVAIIIYKHIELKNHSNWKERVQQSWLYSEDNYWHNTVFAPLEKPMMAGLALLSGYLSKGEPSIKKFESLITYVFLPYVLFTVMLQPFLVFIYSTLGMYRLEIGTMFDRLVGTGKALGAAQWYLLCLLIWRLMLYSVWYLSKQTRTLQLPWFVFLYLMGAVALMHSDLPFLYMRKAIYFMPAFLVGYFMPLEKLIRASAGVPWYVRALLGQLALAAWIACLGAWPWTEDVFPVALPYKSFQVNLPRGVVGFERYIHISQGLFAVLRAAVMVLLLICTVVPRVDLGRITLAGRDALFPYLLHCQLALPVVDALLACIPGPRVENSLGHLAFHLFLVGGAIVLTLVLSTEVVKAVFGVFISPAWCSDAVKSACLAMSRAGSSQQDEDLNQQA